MPQHVGYADGVNLTISLCLTYTICIACVRIYIRKATLGIDDLVIAIATLVSFGHTVSDYAALTNGIGTPWKRVEQRGSMHSLNDASLAGVVLFTIALYLSKCAVLAFLARITKTPSQVRLYQACNALAVLIGVISLLVVTVGCPSYGSGFYWAFYYNKLASCPNQSVRWQAFTALDIVSEVLLLVLPAHLICGLQMKPSKKAMIIAAFWLRLPIESSVSIGRNYYTLKLRLPQADPGLTSGLVVILLEIQLAYALAASTLSASKGFTESFNSGFGLGFTRGRGDDSYNLDDISKKPPDSSKNEKSRNDSALESGTHTCRIASPLKIRPKAESNVNVSRVTPARDISDATEQIKLRPESNVKTFTHVSAEPSFGDLGPWREHSAPSSEYSADDMTILRETGYSVVKDDRAPILGWRRVQP